MTAVCQQVSGQWNSGFNECNVQKPKPCAFSFCVSLCHSVWREKPEVQTKHCRQLRNNTEENHFWCNFVIILQEKINTYMKIHSEEKGNTVSYYDLIKKL